MLAGQKVGLLLRGRRVTGHEIQTLLRDGKDGPALVRAILVPAYVAEVKKWDPKAAHLLAEVAAAHAAALSQAIEGGWVDQGDQAAAARLLELVLASPAALEEAVRRVRARFVCRRESAAKSLLAAKEADRPSQIVLAYAESCPERFGFVTQETLHRERYADLTRRGQRLAAALFWLRLRRVLASNPVIFGRWNVVALSWLGLAVFAWRAGLLVDVRSWIALLLVVPPALRVTHWAGLPRLVKRQAPEAGPWMWRDGVARCSNELPAVLEGAAVSSEERVAVQLAVINLKIKDVPLKEAPQLVTPPGRLPALWTTSIVSWLIITVVLVGAVHSGIHRMREKGWRIFGFGAGNALQASSIGAGADLGSPGADWSFGDPRNPRVAWSLAKPARVPPAGVKGIRVATPEQVAFALVEGERELLPFLRRTVKPLIAVRVAAEGGIGLILFDGADGTVAERRVYLVGQVPAPSSWLNLGGRDVVFLGAATETAAPADAGPEPEPPGKT